MYPFLCNGCGKELEIKDVWYDSFKGNDIETSLIYDYIDKIKNNLRGTGNFNSPEEPDLSFWNKFEDKNDNVIIGKSEKKFEVIIEDDDFLSEYDTDIHITDNNTELPFETREFIIALHSANPKLFRIRPDFEKRKAIIKIKGTDLYKDGDPLSGLSIAYVEYLAKNKHAIESKIIFEHVFDADFDDESQRLITVLKGFGCSAFTPIARCPICGAKLSGDFGKYKEIRIGVLGTERQGKSAVLTATYSTFKNGYGNVTIWDNVAGHGDASITTFGKDYLNRYEKNISIKKTETSDTLAYRFSISQGNNRYNLLFVDIAGELLFDRQNGHLIADEFHRKYRNFIENIDCVWFCIDKSVIDNLITVVPLGLGLGNNIRNDVALNSADCRSLVEFLRDLNKTAPWLVLAVKSDMLDHHFIEEKKREFGSADGHGRLITKENCFDEKMFCKLSGTVRDFIRARNKQLLEALEDSGKLRYSLCSAYGHAVNSFNVAFSDDETVIFVPTGVESVFPEEGQTYSVKIYLGDHLEVGMEPIYENTSVTAIRSKYHNSPIDFDGDSAIALRIGFALTYDTDYVAVVDCDGTRTMFSLRREQLHYRRIDFNFHDGNPLKEFDSLLKSEPWLMEVPLLWTLAVHGKYPTVGMQAQRTHWWARGTLSDIKTSFINNAYSKKILRGETDTYVHPAP